MLSLERFEIHPGNRPGERRVYARCNTGELRRVSEFTEKKVLAFHDMNPGSVRVPLKDRVKSYLGSWHNWYVLPIVLILMLLVRLLVGA